MNERDAAYALLRKCQILAEEAAYFRGPHDGWQRWCDNLYAEIDAMVGKKPANPATTMAPGFDPSASQE